MRFFSLAWEYHRSDPHALQMYRTAQDCSQVESVDSQWYFLSIRTLPMFICTLHISKSKVKEKGERVSE